MISFYNLSEDQFPLITRLGKQPGVGFEIRLDTCSKPPDLQTLRASADCPLMATFRTEHHLGKGKASDRNGRGWDWRLAAKGFEYVDVELDEDRLDEKIAELQAAGHRVVLSHHDLGRGPTPAAIFERAMATKADVIKLIGTGSATTDFAEQRRLYQAAGERPFIHFYMGGDFWASRVLSLIYGAPATYIAPDDAQALAPGQLTRTDVAERFRPNEISLDQMALFGVIGSPIGHSKSPAYHTPPLKAKNPNALLLPFPASEPEDLATLRAAFPELRGLAVTKPMKEHAYQAADAFTAPAATRLGAINTLLFRDDRVIGANTDMLATLELLEEAPQGARVLVLGHGGLGKAVVQAALDNRNPVAVTNRSPERLIDVPDGARVVPWEERHEERPDVIVQTTSAGMAPHETATPLEQWPEDCRLLIETIYNPSETVLMRMAKQAGAHVVDGMALFNGQARIQNEMFGDLLN